MVLRIKTIYGTAPLNRSQDHHRGTVSFTFTLACMIIRQKSENIPPRFWFGRRRRYRIDISTYEVEINSGYRESSLRHGDPGFRCQTRDTEITTVSSNTFFPSLFSSFRPPIDRDGNADTFVIVEIADK